MEGLVTNFETASSEPSENAQISRAINPLEVAGIIKCVFTFLPLRDIKNCRLVSKECNYQTLPFLRKLSQVKFGSHYGNEEFKNAFRFSLTEILFNALQLRTFRIRLGPMLPLNWTESGLREVLADWKTKLKELTIMDVDILDDRFLPRHFNMSDLMSEVNITKLNAVSSFKSRLTFSLKSLLPIKILRLSGCNLIITEEDHLAANHVEIISCHLVFQNNVEKTLNSFINFETAKKVIYHGMGERIKLYTNGQFEFDLLQLRYVSILSWETSNWKVDKLNLSEVNFTGITKIRVRQMIFKSARVNLRDIAETVEKLVNPRSSRYLYPTEIFQAERIVWRMREYPDSRTKFENIVNFISKNEKKVVAVGKFNWDLISVAKCPLSEMVEEESECYVFENGKGNAISEDQFNKMIEF